MKLCIFFAIEKWLEIFLDKNSSFIVIDKNCAEHKKTSFVAIAHGCKGSWQSIKQHHGNRVVGHVYFAASTFPLSFLTFDNVCVDYFCVDFPNRDAGELQLLTQPNSRTQKLNVCFRLRCVKTDFLFGQICHCFH